MRNFCLALLSILLLFVALPEATAQKSGYAVKKADRLYDSFDFEGALKLYQAAAEKGGNNLYLKGRIGNCYKFLNNLQSAEDWYAELAETEGIDAIYKFYYAQALMSNGKYTQAVEYLNRYHQEMNLLENVVSSYPEIFTENDKYTVVAADFNSEYADFSAYQIKEDIFFISNRKEDAFFTRDDVWSHRPFTQIYRIKGEEDVSSVPSTSSRLTDKQKKQLKKEEAKQGPVATKEKETGDPEVFNAGSISSRYHEGPLCWDRTQNDIYITRSNYSSKKAVKGDDDEVNLKIMKLAFNPTTQDYGEKLIDNLAFSKDEFSMAYPTITSDGNYMIFSSDMPGGFGGLDLYVAENIGGIWSNPINLGSKINTPGNEAFPSIMASGTLFFSSDGHMGLGGYDIYTSELMPDGYFDYPTNIRSPVNSQYDDFGFNMDDKGSKGFFSSNRPGGKGDDDIYTFTRQSYSFEAMVFDSKSEEKLINANVILIDLDANEEVVLMTDANGYVRTDMIPNTKYSLRVAKESYLGEEATFTSAEDDIYAEIPLVKDFGIVLDVTVVDKITLDELGESSVVLINMTDDKEESRVTNSYGKISFVLDPEKEYRIKADKDLADPKFDYLAVSEDFNTFNTAAPANLFTTIELEKQEIGKEIVIENIYYDLDKYFIRNDAAKELDLIVKLLTDNPGMEIELSSHTDCRGSAKYNIWLSAKRAEAAVNYLIENGIDYRRLTAAGYGETRPVNGCICENKQGPGLNCSDMEHQANRRTVFTILKF